MGGGSRRRGDVVTLSDPPLFSRERGKIIFTLHSVSAKARMGKTSMMTSNPTQRARTSERWRWSSISHFFIFRSEAIARSAALVFINFTSVREFSYSSFFRAHWRMIWRWCFGDCRLGAWIEGEGNPSLTDGCREGARGKKPSPPLSSPRSLHVRGRKRVGGGGASGHVRGFQDMRGGRAKFLSKTAEVVYGQNHFSNFLAFGKSGSPLLKWNRRMETKETE